MGAAALGTAPAALGQSQRPPQDVLSATDAVVAVHTPISNGAGFVLRGANDEVVTHSGLVRGQETARLTTIDGRQVEGEVIGRDEAAGLAVLSAPGVRVGSIPVAGESAAQDDAVYAIGRPLGYSDRIVALEVDDLGGELAERRIELDAAISADGLGGPLLNAMGDAVGVLVADPGGGARAVPVGRVARMERASPSQGPPWMTIGVGMIGALVGFVALVGWLASRSRRRTVRRYEGHPTG